MKRPTRSFASLVSPSASFLILVLLLELATGTHAAAPMAQQIGGIAQADLRLLLMLHPSMMGYDFTLNRFLKVSPGQKAAYKAAEDEIARRRPEVDKALQTLQLERSKLLREAGSARIAASIRAAPVTTLNESAQVPLFDPAASSTKTVEASTIDKHLEPDGAAGVSLSAERAIISSEKRLAEIDARIQAQYDRLLEPLYHPTTETGKIFNGILSEVKSIIADVARQRGISTVMNACPITSGSPRQLRNPGATLPSGDHSRAFDHLFEALLNTEFDAITLPPLPDTQRVLAGIGMTITEPLRAYLAKSPALAPLMESPETGHLFLYGGVDLTAPAATVLMTKYKFPAGIQQLVLSIIARRQL
ncbi:MAG TPA: hypothetical protein PLU72_19140 [Candidatus Ozemobacteraceae bacterium]|nr:hypothetical protein [Candidatus Ozemobacteraceae bacterium]